MIVKWFYVIGYNILVMEGMVVYLKDVWILVQVVGKIGEEGKNFIDVIRNGEV